MKLEALDHPKTLDLASRLNVELPTAIGYLELLWAFTGKKAPQGNIGKWPDGAIARACYWMGRPEVFILALRESGFIEADHTHRLSVHDWHDHAPGWVRAKLKKLSMKFITSREASSEHSSEPASESSDCRSSEASSEPSIQGKGSTREGKTRKDATAPRPLVLHESLPSTEWDEWMQIRKKHRWPVDDTTLRKQLELLSEYTTDVQREILNTSMRSGWQGIFPPKNSAPAKLTIAHSAQVARPFGS